MTLGKELFFHRSFCVSSLYTKKKRKKYICKIIHFSFFGYFSPQVGKTDGLLGNMRDRYDSLVKAVGLD